MAKPCAVHNINVINTDTSSYANGIASQFKSKLEFSKRKRSTEVTLRSFTNSEIFNAQNGIKRIKNYVDSKFGKISSRITYRKDKSASFTITFSDANLETVSQNAIEPTRLEFYKGDEALMAQEEAEYRFFQDTPDGKRRNKILENELIKILDNHGIRVIDLKDYKAEFKARTGKDFEEDPIALMDQVNRVIAVSWDKAGRDSLPEEVGHLIEAYAMQSDVDTWNILMNDKVLQETREYKSGYADALTRYNGNALKAKREIVGRILGKHLQEAYIEHSSPKILRYVARIFKRFFGYFRSKKTTAAQDAVNKAYGDLAAKFFTDSLNIEGTSFEDNYIRQPKDSRITSIAHKTLVQLSNRLRGLKKRREGLRGGLIKKRYEELNKKHDINSLEETIEIFEALTYPNEEQINTLKELYEFLNLRELDRADKQNVEKLKVLTTQIGRLTTEIKKKEEVRGLEVFILGLQITRQINEQETETTREGGLDQDLEIIKNILSNIREGKREFTKDLFKELQEFSEYYTDVLSELNGMFEAGQTIEGLSDASLFKKIVKKNLSDLQALNDFLDISFNDIIKKHLRAANTDSNGDPIDPNLNVDDVVKDRQYFDRNLFQVYFGSVQHAIDPIFQFAFELLAKTKNKVDNYTRKKAVEIYSQVDVLLDDIRSDNTFMNKLRDLGYKTIEETMIELDSEGKKTEFMNNQYQLGGPSGFNSALEEASDRIIEETEKYAEEQFGVKIFIPRGPNNRANRSAFFGGEDILGSTLSDKEKTKQLTNRDKVNTFYRTAWRDWFKGNTQALKIRNLEDRLKAEQTTSKERGGLSKKDFIAKEVKSPSGSVNYIIRARKRELTNLEFQEWASRNIQSTHHGEVYYTGELSTPASKYVNPRYQELKKNANWLKLRTIYNRDFMEAKRKLPNYITNDYTARHVLPQISQTLLDVLKKNKSGTTFKNIKADIKDLATSAFVSRSDDELYASHSNILKGDGTMFKTPPVRFTTKLENPSMLSSDTFASLIMFIDMAENYVRFSENVPEFNLYQETIKRRKYNKRRGIKSNLTIWRPLTADDYIGGEESNAYKNIKDFLDAYVYGNNEEEATFMLGNLDVNKVSSSVLDWIRRKNLQGNFPAIGAGFVLANKATFNETLVGRYINLESSTFALKELTTNVHNIVMELGSPLKKNKVSLLVEHARVMQDNREVFKDLDKKRYIRIAQNMLNYGMWKLADFFPKAHATVALADNYRLIEGKWYTKRKWKEQGGSKEQWSSNKTNSFYNLLELDGSNLVSPHIGEEQWNFITNNAKRLASHIDTQASDFDRSLVARKWWGKFLVLHRSWTWQGLERRFKKEHFNRYTGSVEKGYTRSFWQFARSLTWDNGFLTGLFRAGQEWNVLSDVEKEGVLRVTMNTAWSLLFYALAYSIHGIMFEDDDAEEDPMLMYTMYLSTRLVMEQTAFVSPKEFIDILSRPVAGLDMYGAIGQLISDLVLYITDREKAEKPIQSGPYEGKARIQRTVTRLTPIARGFYETAPVAIPGTEGAKGLKAKDEFLRSRVLGGEYLTKKHHKEK